MTLLDAAGLAFQAAPAVPGGPPDDRIDFNLQHIYDRGSLIIQATIILLALISIGVWIVGILKLIHVFRLRSGLIAFERMTRRAQTSAQLYELAPRGKDNAGGRVLLELYSRGANATLERLRAVADRAIVTETKNARSLMAMLSTGASASPFIGLFGTVFGILMVFMGMNGKEGASLAAIVPKVGEALITTGIGLFPAAIPALVFYNLIDKMAHNFVAELEGAAGDWVTLIHDSEAQEKQAPALRPVSNPPAARQATQPY
jgi:biopolymer transport protein TolQ